MRPQSCVTLALLILARMAALDAESFSLTMYLPVVAPENLSISWRGATGEANAGSARATAVMIAVKKRIMVYERGGNKLNSARA